MVAKDKPGATYEAYSPKCVEEVSVLKNSFALSSAPVQGLKTPFL
jgi:hypothetical protein